MFSKLDEQIIADNKKYADAYTSGGLDVGPTRKLVVVTCMDCRLNPQEAMGWKLGEVTVCRNAGASSRDAARSLIATTHLLGAEDIYVIKHTRCGLLGVPTEVVHSVMKKNLNVERSKDVDSFEVIPITNLEESAKEDVEFLRNHPLALKKVRVTGWIFDTDTGLLKKVVD